MSPAPEVKYVDYAPRGACKELFRQRGDQVIIAGPAGTGKSRASLELLHAVAEKYPKARGLIVRKTRASLNNTALVTFEEKVLYPGCNVRFHTTDQEYKYSNGSIVGIAGMDKASKIMSSEYDIIYVQECTELTEDDWQMLTTRIRNGVVPTRQQLLGDCNPGPPTHWIKKAADAGKLVMLESRHEDNPALWDEANQCWTEEGAKYIGKLNALTGVRYKRLRLGIWASSEGIIYDMWDRAIHIVDRFLIPDDWPCYWAIDFGFTNPFVWQEWREDPDGRLYRTTEIYRTKTLVEDHAKAILAATEGHPKPRAIICDHDAEDRATLTKYLNIGTIGAWKTVSPGLQAVQQRLRRAGDGKPRIMFMRDSLVERDTDLLDAAKPVCTEEEVEGYIWDPKFKKGEQPLKQGDHGCDVVRYVTCFVDDVAHNHLLGLNQWMAGETAVQNELMKEQPKKLESVNLVKPTTSDKTLACPNCENIRVARLPNGQGYRCNNCGTQFGGKAVAPPTQNRHDYLRK